MTGVPDRNGELLQVGDTVRLWSKAKGGFQPMKRLATIYDLYGNLVRIMTSTGKFHDYIRTMVEKIEGEEKPEKEERRKNMVKEKQTKVWWTGAEKEKLVHLVITRQEANSGLPLLQCVQHVASTSMPEGRRRHIRYMSIIKEWFNPLYNKYWRAKPYAKEKEDAPSPPKEDEAPREQVEKKEEMIPTEFLIRAFSAWLRKLDQRLAAIEESALEAATRPLSESAQQTVAREKRRPGTPVEKQPLLVVIGIKSQRYNELRSHFEGKVRFEFFSPDDYKRTLPLASRYFAVTKFLPHKWSERLKAEGLGERVIRVTGGVSSLRDQINVFLKSNGKEE